MLEQTRRLGACETGEYVITTLAEYQTEFWMGVARRLLDAGCAVSFISFDDNSTRMLQSAGLEVYALTSEAWRANPSNEEIEERLSAFDLFDTARWYAHEKWNFEAWDESVLDKRLYLYLGLCQRALSEVMAQGRRPVMIQELGGFLSVIAAFHASRRSGVDNWFIEPSFFRGSCFWLRNSFAAASGFGDASAAVEPEAIAYLEKALREQAIVIPLKDRHQYATPARKILNFRNVVRLTEKVLDKYVRGRRQEFSHLGAHVRRHLATLAAASRLRSKYTALEDLGRFVYYPLHVPGDMALTLRSHVCLDQLALIEAISRQLPRGVKLAIKEHPAMIGALGSRALIDVLRRNQNVALLDPSRNNYDVMKRCAAVVSVNSKSGAEALLLDKPVVVLGDAFYRGSGLTTDITSVGEVGEALIKATVPDPHDRAAFFSEVWRRSHPGELYVNETANLDIFAVTLQNAVGPE